MEVQDFNNIDLVERYHLGEMDAAERAEFEARLKTDPELAKENADYLALVGGIDLHGEQNLRRKLAGVEAALETEGFFREAKTEAKTAEIRPELTVSHRAPQRFWWAAAAALAVVAAAVFFLKNKPASPENAFAQFYKPETAVLKNTLARLESSGMANAEKYRQDSLASALSAYERGQYDEANRQLEGYLTAYPNDQLAELYLGLTLVQQQDLAGAIARLDPLAADEKFEHKTTARWYLALALVKKGDAASIARANSLLENLHNDPKSGYFREAENFLKLVEQL